MSTFVYVVLTLFCLCLLGLFFVPIPEPNGLYEEDEEDEEYQDEQPGDIH